MRTGRCSPLLKDSKILAIDLLQPITEKVWGLLNQRMRKWDLLRMASTNNKRQEFSKEMQQ